MMVDSSPEKLPDGWTVQYNVLKTGRKIKYYLNSKTGKKSFSKEDVARQGFCTNRSDRSRGTKNTVNRRLISHQMPLPHDKSNSNKWLPDGWITEVKVRRGSGKNYKCFVDPSTNCKFYSKPQVVQYLRAHKRKSGNSAQRDKVKNVHPAGKIIADSARKSQVMAIKPIMDELPPGWIKEVKVRRIATGIRKDAFYRDPVTGHVFRSKREVQRYLETGEMNRRSRKWRKVNNISKTFDKEDVPCCTLSISIAAQPEAGKDILNKHTESNQKMHLVNAENNGLEWLPDGWIVKTKRGGGRTYKCYVDPSTNCKFFSKPKLLQYLESQKHEICTSKPMKTETSVQTAAKSSKSKRPKLAESADQQKLSGDKLIDDAIGANKTKSASLSHLPDANISSKTVGKEEITNNVRASSLGSAITQDDDFLVRELKRNTSKRSKLAESADQQKLPGDKLIDNATGSNNTLTASLSILPHPNISSETVGKEETANYERALSLGSVITQDNDLLVRELKRNRKQKVRRSWRSNCKKLLALPCRSSKRLAGHDPEMAGLSLLGSRRSQKLAKSSGSDSKVDGMNTSESSESKALVKLVVEQKVELESHARTDVVEPHEQTDPLEQLQKLETEKHFLGVSNDKMNPPIAFLTDPCLAFAIRTLTGDMPVEAAVACVLPSTLATGVANEKTLTGDVPVEAAAASVLPSIPATDVANEKTLTGDVPVEAAVARVLPSMPAADVSNEKTLTRDVPVEAAVACVLPSTPAINMANEKKIIGESIQKGSSGTCAVNASKSKSTKEVNLPRRYSRRLSRHVPQGRVNSVSNPLKFSSEAETSPSVDLGRDKGCANHCSTSVKAVRNYKPSNERKRTNNRHAEMRPEKAEMPTNDSGNSIPKPVFPFADFWLDPCLQFAVKTLTGEIPVEKNPVLRDLHRELCESHAQTQTRPKATVVFSRNDGRSDLHRELCESHAQTQAKATVIYSNHDGSLALPNLDLHRFAASDTSTLLQYPLNGALPLPVGEANICCSNAFQLRKPPFKGSKGQTEKLSFAHLNGKQADN